MTVTIPDTKGLLDFCIYFVTFQSFGHFSTEVFVFCLLIYENFSYIDGINCHTCSNILKSHLSSILFFIIFWCTTVDYVKSFRFLIFMLI